MNYKLINRLDPIGYLGLALVGFIMPEVTYRIFLFDFSAVMADNQALIIRSIGIPILPLWLSSYLEEMPKMESS